MMLTSIFVTSYRKDSITASVSISTLAVFRLKHSMKMCEKGLKVKDEDDVSKFNAILIK